MTNYEKEWLLEAIEVVSSGLTRKMTNGNILVYSVNQIKNPLVRVDIRLNPQKRGKRHSALNAEK